MEITELSQLDLSKTYSYADYFSWKFRERVELIKGKIVAMSPAPATKHQRILTHVGTEIAIYLKNKPCEVFFAPFDVRLERQKEDKKIQNVVQPDICVICDETKIDERGCIGAPDLVVEILSPGNTKKEMKYKFELYEAAGVLEYWIVDLTEKTILQYILKEGQFLAQRPLIEEDRIESHVLKGFVLELSEVFK